MKMPLLNPMTFKEKTGLDTNNDDRKILNAMMTHQETELEPLLGTAMYKDYMKRIADDTNGVSNALREIDESLKDYINDVLIRGTEVNLATDMLIDIRTNGIYKNEAESSYVASLNEVNIYKEKKQRELEAYQSRLIEFINENIESFTLYKDALENGDVLTGSGEWFY